MEKQFSIWQFQEALKLKLFLFFVAGQVAVTLDFLFPLMSFIIVECVPFLEQKACIITLKYVYSLVFLSRQMLN